MATKFTNLRNFLSLFVLVLIVVSQSNGQNPERFFSNKDLTQVGVYYYPEHWDSTQWDRDFQNMANMGFEFTHFAEFAWAQLEPTEGVYDFKWLDRSLQLAEKYNLKVILCTSTATPPVWLVRNHPEVLATEEGGYILDHGARQHATFSSSYYRTYALKMVEELARRYGNDERVIGWQIDNEPRRFLDYGAEVPQRFRNWLKLKYSTIDALNNAWGTNFWSGTYSSFDEINIPLYKQWGINIHAKLDHYRFADWETASFVDEQARAIRKYSSPNQYVTSNYQPQYDFGFVGGSQELDFVSYTRYMVYGGDKGIGPKGYRVGEYSRIAMANDFFRPMKGVYGVMELQPGQVNWGSVNPQPLPGAMRLWLWHIFAGGSKFACTYRYRAPLYGFEAFHYGIVGTDGVTPTSGGVEFRQFINEISNLREKYNDKAKLPKSYLQRKTGILYNTDNVQGINLNKQTVEWNTEMHFLKYYKALKSFGAPVDFVRDTANFDNYPVLLVPAYQMIDQMMIDKLTRYAENGGNLVMTCRTGLQDRNGHLWEAKFYQPMWKLFGAEVLSYDLLVPQSPATILFNNQEYSWTSWGDLLKPYSGTETWGIFRGDFYAGTPAIVSHRLGKGTVTYIGVDSNNGSLEKQVLTKLYKQQNIPIENYPVGVMVEYRDGFGVAVNYSNEVYELNLPTNAEILIGTKAIKTADVLVWKY
jgi:beta-galactosidase